MANSPKFSDLYGYDFAKIRDAAEKLGLQSISTPEDVAKVKNYIDNPGSSFQALLNPPSDYTKPFEFQTGSQALNPFQLLINQSIQRDVQSPNLRFKPTPITTKPVTTKGYTYTDPGDKFAFGVKDLQELRAQGVSDDEIKYIASQSAQVGPKALSELNLAGTLENYQGGATPDKTNPNYTYTDPGDKDVFGMEDFRELYSQGVGEDVMRYVAQSKGNIGDVAKRVLGLEKGYKSGGQTPGTIKPSTQGVKATNFLNAALNKARNVYTTQEDFDKANVGERILYTDPGDKGVFGMKDAEELRNQGMTDEDIKYFASTQGKVGPKAALKYGLSGTTDASGSSKTNPNYTYTDPGDKDAFGMKDYEELYRQGVGEDEMRFIASGQKRVGEVAARLLGIEAR